jgi:glycosyltransferase involved in cell wall biosynthesis
VVFGKKIKVLLVQGHAKQTNTAAFNRNAAVEKMVKSVFDYELIAPEKPFSKIKNRIISGVINRHLLVKVTKKKIAKCSDQINHVIFLRSIDPFVALFIWLSARPKGIKLALERNEFPAVFIQNGSNLIKKMFYRYFILPWHYRLFDVLFLMTDELLQFYGRYAGQHCILQKLPMTVDFTRFESNTLPSPDVPYIFYAGSLSEAKDGVESLICAFSKIADDFPELSLKIAGGSKTGTLEKRLSDIIAEKQLSDRISLLGFVDRNEIPQYLCAAKMVVLPRPDSLQARGGFPTKLGEYLAAGRPVIVTRVGEIPKYLSEDDVFFISPDDIENELIQKMKYILLHEKKALETASSGKAAAKKYFSLEANQGSVKSAFERLFEKK